MIVLVILIMPIGTIICMINEISLDRVLLGALCVAVFAFFIRDCNKPRISSEEESWRQFCSEIGAKFIKEKSPTTRRAGGLMKPPRRGLKSRPMNAERPKLNIE